MLLALNRYKGFDMWLHHALAISIFAVILVSNTGGSGGMLVLMGEALVPWGFFLFYFKTTNIRDSVWFRTVCIGGMSTLVFRACLWTFFLCVTNLTTLRTEMPRALYWIVNSTGSGAFYLEYTWFILYYRNYVKACDGKRPTTNPVIQQYTSAATIQVLEKFDKPITPSALQVEQ